MAGCDQLLKTTQEEQKLKDELDTLKKSSKIATRELEARVA